MEPISGIDRINKYRLSMKCNVCKKSNTLGMMQCGFNSCFVCYHPTCGFKAGYAMVLF